MTVWAREFMDEVVDAFRMECYDHGKPHYFEVFDRRHLRPEHHGNPTNSQIAEALGINERRVANCLHNAKRNFNTILRAMVRASVGDESMVEQEMLDLEKYLWLAVKH